MGARHALNPNQLKMFMSADEITTHYQPWDPDRESYEPEPSEMWSTATPRSTHEDEPTVRPYRATDWTATRGGGTGMRTGGGTLYRPKDFQDTEESDEELWSRKAEEASWDYKEMGKSLYETVQESGPVEQPVSLGSQIGSQGKPQIVGGHHRIAVSREVDPHALMPVLHIKGGLGAARNEGQRRGGWRYT